MPDPTFASTPHRLCVKRLRPGAKLPTKAYPHDAGWDLYWCPDADEQTPQVQTYGRSAWIVAGTGLAFDVPVGWCLVLFGRSGMAAKCGVDGMAGVVDAGYRGEVRALLSVPLRYLSPGSYEASVSIAPGDRIAQALLLPVQDAQVLEVSELSPGERGDAGFGSSGQ